MSARRVRLLLLAAGLMAAACGPSGAASSGGPLATPSPSPATPAPSPHGDTLTSGASIGYDGFRDWATASGWGGIAVVRVVGVGPLRWTTRDGARPSEGELHGAPPGLLSRPGIGRLISVREVRTLSGQWLGARDGAVYWRPGGQLGLDIQEEEIPLPEFIVGQTAIAFVLPQDLDFGNGGPLPVQIGWLFPVDAAGRVQTLDPRETITLDTIASYLQ